jgi:UDP-glucose:(heptosyl)LPS alpha-1,3-glucosyltransferase
MQEKTLNIAIIRRSYRPDGGAERIIQRILAALMQQYPAKITLISQAWQANNSDKHIQLFNIKKRFCLLRQHCVNYFIKDVQTALQSQSFDLIQSHERIAGSQLYRAGDGVHAEWLTIRKRHASPLKRTLLDYSPFQKTMCRAEKEMFLHPALQRVICVSKLNKQEILQHYPQVDADKLTVIYNGIDLEQYQPITQAQKHTLRQQYHFDKQANIAIFVGSGFERKALRHILNVLANSPQWQLLVIGKDKNQAAFEQLCQHLGIADRVHFKGVQISMQDWYGMADLLIHPAWYEPFGNVILEAMACGLGVICSKNCGVAELISTGKEGYTLQYDDEAQLLDYLHICLDAEHRNALGKAARKTAEHYPISRMIEHFISIYQALLKK